MDNSAVPHPFTERIQKWYDENKRDLPWRNTKNPYHIWISEIILQQTQVVQGLGYYCRFIETFPTVETLANAPLEQVLKVWQGLGYYSRARNLHEAAQQIVASGSFPSNYDAIRSLKGVGDYTASAIASFAFGLCTATVDGNVYRVLSRYFGIDLPIDKGEGQRYFKALASELIDCDTPARFNQAVMEFGALYCTPKGYNCTNCPLNEGCIAASQGNVDQLPYKAGKIKMRKRYFHYIFIVLSDGRMLLFQRKAKDIWQGLFEPYLVETPSSLYEPDAVMKQLSHQGNLVILSEVKKHILSHQHLFTTFYTLTSNSPVTDEQWLTIFSKTANTIATTSFEQYAVPRLIEWGYEQWIKYKGNLSIVE